MELTLCKLILRVRRKKSKKIDMNLNDFIGKKTQLGLNYIQFRALEEFRKEENLIFTYKIFHCQWRQFPFVKKFFIKFSEVNI